MAIDASRFQQKDSMFSVLAEAMRKNTACRTRADNDVVELAHVGPVFYVAGSVLTRRRLMGQAGEVYFIVEC